MKLCEMIKVMQHFDNGGAVEFKQKREDDTKWRLACPNWNWDSFNYQIKKPKVTIEKWLMRGDTGCCFVLEGDSRYFEGYQNITKVKLLDTYEVEL